MTALPRYLIGIDPGIHGAIAVLEMSGTSFRLLWVEDLPLAVSRGKAELMLHTTSEMLQDWHFAFASERPHVFVEYVHAAPKQGLSSTFRFGYAAGALAGLVVGLGYPISFITPQHWQKIVNVAPDPGSGRKRASELFPDSASAFARVKDHNRADAALIAWAGIRALTFV